MDGVKYVVTAGGGIGSPNLERTEQPLTNDILDRISRSQDTASEIGARLFSLRDRLFGTPAETAGGSGPVPPSPSSFQGCVEDRLLNLQRSLNYIDSLSSDINNRL